MHSPGIPEFMGIQLDQDLVKVLLLTACKSDVQGESLNF